MSTFPKTISLADLSDDVHAALAAVQASSEPVRVSKGDDCVAIMMRPDQYELLQRQLELLKHLLSGELSGELDIATDNARDLESVMAAADELLGGQGPKTPHQ